MRFFGIQHEYGKVFGNDINWSFHDDDDAAASASSAKTKKQCQSLLDHPGTVEAWLKRLYRSISFPPKRDHRTGCPEYRPLSLRAFFDLLVYLCRPHQQQEQESASATGDEAAGGESAERSTSANPAKVPLHRLSSLLETIVLEEQMKAEEGGGAQSEALLKSSSLAAAETIVSACSSTYYELRVLYNIYTKSSLLTGASSAADRSSSSCYSTFPPLLSDPFISGWPGQALSSTSPSSQR